MKRLLIIAYITSILIWAGSMANAATVTVVVPSSANPSYGYAAQQFSKYAESMLNTKVPIVKDSSKLNKNFGVVAIIGDSSVNKTLKTLESDTGTKYSELIPDRKDSFIAKSIDYKGTTYIILAGRDGISTLYSVYDYLEKVCRVGFFEDCERIPKLKSLPVINIDIVEKPFFEDRFYRVWPRMLRKTGFVNWSKQDWINKFDWMAKKRINLTWSWLFREDFTFGTVYDVAYPEIGTPSGVSKEIMNLRRKNGQEAFAFASKVGVRKEHFLDFGNVPGRFMKAHPELKYLPNVGDPNSPIYYVALDPTDPKTSEVFSKFFKEIINTFGTDHIYDFEPYGEGGGGKTNNDEAFKIKSSAWLAAYNSIKKIDPKAKVIWGGWDYLVLPQILSIDNVKKFCTEMVPKDIYFTETGMECIGDKSQLKYKQHNYYYDHDFAIGTILGLAGNYELHYNFNEMAQRFNDLANDPKATRCRGIFHESECAGHNLLMYEMYFKNSWNPKGFSRDEFVKDFCERRYGSSGLDKMIKATNMVIDTLLNGDINQYITNQYLYNHPDQLPFGNANYLTDQIKKTDFTTKNLRQILEIMLIERENQKGNPCYDSDLTQYLISYIGELFRNSIMRTYMYFKAGDKDNFEVSSRSSLNSLDELTKLLSTRKEYSILETVNSSLPRPERLHVTEKDIVSNFTYDYQTELTFEQVPLQYKRDIESYLNELSKKISKPEVERTLSLSDISPAVAQHRTEFYYKYKEHVDSLYANAFKGKITDLIKESLDNLKMLGDN